MAHDKIYKNNKMSHDFESNLYNQNLKFVVWIRFESRKYVILIKHLWFELCTTWFESNWQKQKKIKNMFDSIQAIHMIRIRLT